MRGNHISDVVKILILAASVIITCIIVAVGMHGVEVSKQLSNTAIAQVTDLNNELKDSGIKKYDGISVMGSEVINVMKKYLGDYEEDATGPLYVYVDTEDLKITYYNKAYFSDIIDFTDEHYIKPTATFLGEVIKNENDVIVGINFVQE